jgi:hypothetical protein
VIDLKEYRLLKQEQLFELQRMVYLDVWVILVIGMAGAK